MYDLRVVGEILRRLRWLRMTDGRAALAQPKSLLRPKNLSRLHSGHVENDRLPPLLIESRRSEITILTGGPLGKEQRLE